jgi:glycosyltransferase involved in cell wall biosynthesis
MFKVPCICEVRDLWPESIVEFGNLKRNSIAAKLLYKGEKWIYKKADKVIFTMEGGKDYIIEHGWNKESGGPIDLDKVHHINNGIDLDLFNFNKENFTVDDIDLDNPQILKVVYAGSIRHVNNVKSIIYAADIIKNNFSNKIKFIIYGDGSEREYLEKYCLEKKINNVVFKGFVDKKYIPYILNKCDLNIMHFNQNSIKKYGASLNKMFEYFASGKPTLSDCEFGYDLIKKYNCGIVVDNANAEQLAKAVVKIYEMSEEEYNEYCKNAIIVAKDYDYKILTDKLVKYILGAN